MVASWLDLDQARRTPWTVVYLAAGVAMVVNLCGDAYARAASVCELYPEFAFGETLREELLLHHTRLPIVRAPVSTPALLAAYALSFVALRVGLVENAWLFLHAFFSGRWLVDLLFVHLPNYLPFLYSEPGVPDLLTDGEDTGGALSDDDEGLAPAPPVNEQQMQRALEKLLEVKQQHANRTIARPDDWLVFDPEQEALVLQKTKVARVSPSHANGTVFSDKGDELHGPAAPGDANNRSPTSPNASAGKKRMPKQDATPLVPNGSVRHPL